MTKNSDQAALKLGAGVGLDIWPYQISSFEFNVSLNYSFPFRDFQIFVLDELVLKVAMQYHNDVLAEPWDKILIDLENIQLIGKILYGFMEYLVQAIEMWFQAAVFAK